MLRRHRFRIYGQHLLFVGMLCTSTLAFAGGFQVWEESASGTGDYHAGGAAEANDAGTTFYNPAGMIRLHNPEFSTGAVFIPLGLSYNGLVGGTPTGGYVSGGTKNLVPNFHFVFPVYSWMIFGFGVTTPFGLATDYPGNSQPLATAATLTKIETVNLNPDLAFAITDKLSVGAGFDALYGRAKYNSEILGTASFLNALSAWGYGWNAGALYQFTDHTRVGASYRSKIQLDARGQSQSVTVLLTTTNDRLNSELNLPATTIFSFYSDVTPKWSLMASAYYTKWDLFDDLILNDTTLFPSISVHENYRDTWNYSVGAHFQATQIFMLKAGIGWDQTPTQDGFRDVRLPDVDRFAAAIGARIQAARWLAIDVGWTHFFTRAADVDNDQSGLPDFLVTQGTAKMNVNVFGAQLTMSLR